MLQLRAFGDEARVRSLGVELERAGLMRAATLVPAPSGGRARLEGEVDADAADRALALARAAGLAEDSVSLVREETVGGSTRFPTASLIWSDMLGQAAINSRLLGRYLAFMSVAGVVAGFGVIYDNGILIVGAMAISPDVLPIAAICVGAVAADGRLVVRAGGTLVTGFLATCAWAGAMTAVLDPLGLLPTNFEVGAASLSGLTSVNVATIGVAVAAGVAAMLALETRASAGVGVAISVTTIPAAAYLGVAAGIGDAGKVLGALAVLGSNVVALIAAGTLTLIVQRRLTSARSTDPDAGGGGASSPGSEEAGADPRT
ncbi:MAG: DUF389 domain-containing protein [Actinobacteria bacterium]|nr:DUF389 domain-containing protein [Actinomycetota bacterium]